MKSFKIAMMSLIHSREVEIIRSITISSPLLLKVISLLLTRLNSTRKLKYCNEEKIIIRGEKEYRNRSGE